MNIIEGGLFFTLRRVKYYFIMLVGGPAVRELDGARQKY